MINCPPKERNSCPRPAIHGPVSTILIGKMFFWTKQRLEMISATVFLHAFSNNYSFEFDHGTTQDERDDAIQNYHTAVGLDIQ